MTVRLFRGFGGWLLGLVLVAALTAAVAAWWGWRAWTGPGPENPGKDLETILMEVPAGMTLGAAADSLVARGLLGDRRILLAGARLSGQDRSLRAGVYRLEYGTSPRNLLANLTRGLSVQVKVTIPEGLDSEATAAILARELEFDGSLFLQAADSLVRAAARDQDLLGDKISVAHYDSLLFQVSRSGVRTYRWSEGYLAPDTYQFSAGTTAESAAEHLVATQLARVDSLMSGSGIENPQVITAHQLLTLASIIEAEARLDEERALVSAVYSNRLAKRWRLEADPTVAFILDKKGKRLFYRDLEVESPFNTYRNKGLPPGPIGSPGWLALQAAASPDTACQAMYFVSDGQGGHVFSRTAREHQEAVQRFREIKAAERKESRH